jgi:tetratricopeptide (TPR) repeat protein
MAKDKNRDLAFDIQFFETILNKHAAYDDVIEILGGLYTKAGRIEDGLKMDKKLVKLHPDNPTAHYNLACSLALVNKPKSAVDSLTQAIELGYRDVEWLAQDPDLESLKTDSDFVALVGQLKTLEKSNNQ